MYLKNTYKDELGEEGFTQFLATHIMKQLIATQIVNESRHGGIMLKLKTEKVKIRDSFEILQRSDRCIRKQLGKSVPLDVE
jgi:penicillin amidase